MSTTVQLEALSSNGFDIITKEKEYSANELKNESETIAAYLIDAGIGPGSRVVVQMTRSFEQMAALTGVFMSGATLIILSKDTPVSRFEYIIGDLNPQLIITDAQYADIKKSGKVFDRSKVVEAGELEDGFIIYTSGSTGLPKGVIHTQVSTGKIVTELNDKLKDKFTKVNRSIALTDATFLSFLVFEYGYCLSTGKTMRLMGDDEVNSVIALGDALSPEGMVSIFMTPSRYKAMTETQKVKDGLNKGGLLILAGEKLPADLEEEIKKEYSDKLTVVDVYGDTECCVISARDIRNNKCITFTPYKIIADGKVTDGDGELCAIDEKIFRDYSKSGVKKTITVDGVTYFPTGDLADVSPQGVLSIHGRNDRMIKYNGLRIELDEISEVLKHCQGVKDAAVVYSKTHNRIAAFYTADSKLETKALRQEMSHKIPFYMLPHSFDFLEEMPLSEHGKMDFVKLTGMFDENFSGGADIALGEKTTDISTLSDNERLLYETIKGLINIDFSVDNSCMELGIDSLMGLNLIAALGEKGFTVSLKDIILSGSVRDLASHMKEKQDTKTKSGDFKIEKRPVTNGYQNFLISNEKSGNDFMAMWIKDIFIGKATYTKESFEERIKILAGRHPVLGCEYVQSDEGFIQEFGKVVPHISFFDISDKGDSGLKEAIENYENVHLKDLEDRQGKREASFACFKLDDERCAIHIKISHTISDGMSQQVLINELLSDSVPKESDSYFEYLSWMADENNRKEATEFFKEYVKGADYAYTKPLVDQVPGMPGMGPMPGMPSMPDMGQMPGMPPMPDMGQMPGMPPMPDMGSMPDMPPMSGMPPMPDMQGGPAMMPLPDMDGIPLMSMTGNIIEMVHIGNLDSLKGKTPFVYALYRYANAVVETLGKDKVVFYITSSGRNIPVNGMDKVVGDLSARMPVVIRKGQSIEEFMEGIYEAENHLCITPEELWADLLGEQDDPVNFPILVSEVFPDYTQGRFLERVKAREFDPFGINAYFLEEMGELYIRVSYNPAIKDEAVFKKLIELLAKED